MYNMYYDGTYVHTYVSIPGAHSFSCRCLPLIQYSYIYVAKGNNWSYKIEDVLSHHISNGLQTFLHDILVLGVEFRIELSHSSLNP